MERAERRGSGVGAEPDRTIFTWRCTTDGGYLPRYLPSPDKCEEVKRGRRLCSWETRSKKQKRSTPTLQSQGQVTRKGDQLATAFELDSKEYIPHASQIRTCVQPPAPIYISTPIRRSAAPIARGPREEPAAPNGAQPRPRAGSERVGKHKALIVYGTLHNRQGRH